MNSSLTDPSWARAARRLQERRVLIIEQWCKRARKQMAAAAAQTNPALQDSLPKFLDCLVETFHSEDPAGMMGEICEVANEHGEDRAGQREYDLSQVIHEYHLLREVLAENLDLELPLSFQARQLLHAFIDTGIRKASVRFMKIRAAEIAEREERLHAQSKRTQEAEERLGLALEAASLGFWELDLKTNHLAMSKQMLNDWGLAEDQSPHDLGEALAKIHPEDRPLVKQAIEHSVRNGDPYDIEYRVLRRSGDEAWIHAQGKIFRSPDTIPRFVGTAADITDRKRVEHDLAFERHKLESIFQDSPAAMVLWKGADLVFEKVNPTYQSIFGERQLAGLPISQAIPELNSQGFPDLLKKVLDTGEPFIGIESLAKVKKTEDGPLEERYYDFTYSRISDLDGKPYGVYDHAIDVTARVMTRRRLEENEGRLRATVEDLEREKILRERFVAALTHDMRTPMTAVRITAQLLQRKHPDIPSVRISMQKVVANIDRADRMIRDLLDANRIKAGEGIPISPERCDLDQVANLVVNDMRELHGPRFSLRNENGPIVGYWDSGSLRRVIENLFGNALKYGQTDAPISVILAKGEDWAEIAVHNEGNPISDQDQKNLFRPYGRTESAVSGGQRGWGIGLTLVKWIAEAHRGTVSVVSNEKNGTTFCVRLPLDSRGQHGAGENRQ